MKKLFVLGLAALALTLGARSANACDCAMEDPTPDRSFSESKGVFSGKVIQVQPVYKKASVDERELDSYIYTFEVKSAYKGDDHRFVNVVTQSSGSRCGSNYDLGKSYLVWANQPGDEPNALYSSNNCSRTNNIEKAKADLRWLERRSRQQ